MFTAGIICSFVSERCNKGGEGKGKMLKSDGRSIGKWRNQRRKSPFGKLVFARCRARHQPKKKVGVRATTRGILTVREDFFAKNKVRQLASALPKIKTGLDMFLFLLSHSRV